MRGNKPATYLLTFAFIASTLSPALARQANVPGGTLRGTVTLESGGTPVHNVTITILQLRRSVETDESGRYEFTNVPPGNYDVTAHLHRVPDVVRSVRLAAGAAETLDFQLRITGVKEEVTVTASGNEESSFNSLQSVTSLSAVELTTKNTASIGEALDHELGVSKRSFGPGNSRPVVRGFDGDRVLVVQDGQRIGSLGAQSGDHGEPIDVLTVEKLEVVKGPATLLYGSNAIGGVVNAVTGHEYAHKGVQGYLTGLTGTNREQLGGSGGVEYGTERWLIWGSGGSQRADDYRAGEDRIVRNSFTRSSHGSAGVGHFRDKGFFNAGYTYNRSRYGIPVDTRPRVVPVRAGEEPSPPESVFLTMRRHSVSLKGGFRETGTLIDSGTFSAQYNDYEHSENDSFTGLANTTFKNKTFVYNAMFDHQRVGRHSGTFGFWGQRRDFDTVGEEAIAPPTKQNSFAAFGLEKIDFDRLSLQFGARVEHNSYDPDGLMQRSFTGVSAAAGMRVQTWTGGAFVANYTHSYRAPALEELYNNGPHPGNLVFEIGDANLRGERGDGIELGARHSSSRLRGEFNVFLYRMRNFIFLSPTGEKSEDEESEFPIAEYRQGDSRFTGFEAQVNVGLHRYLWLTLGADYVNAELTDMDTPLPRIPPLRGRVGLEFNYQGLRVQPEAVLAKDQSRVFPLETRTPGYSVFNVMGSYTLTSAHIAHVFAVSAFNLTDKLYFNHLSFIKDIAPEIGRGARLTYTMRFF